MKRRDLNQAVDEILLTVFERETKHPDEFWTLRSAFSVKDRGDYQESAALVLNALINRGWAISDEDTSLTLKEREDGGLEIGQRVEPAVQLTERGRDRVFMILRAREKRSPSEVIREAHWPMWGGLAAIVAAIASVAAAFLSYLAIAQ